VHYVLLDTHDLIRNFDHFSLCNGFTLVMSSVLLLGLDQSFRHPEGLATMVSAFILRLVVLFMWITFFVPFKHAFSFFLSVQSMRTFDVRKPSFSSANNFFFRYKLSYIYQIITCVLNVGLELSMKHQGGYSCKQNK
jgi:hypothetical protein